MGILIRGGRIIDAATDTDKIGDIYLEDGMIKEIGDQLTRTFQRSRTNTEGRYRNWFTGSSQRRSDYSGSYAKYFPGDRRAGPCKLCT